MGKSDTDVIIIGAGISGLACAKNLMKRVFRYLFNIFASGDAALPACYTNPDGAFVFIIW